MSTASDAIRQAGQRWRWRWQPDRRVGFAIFACFFALGIGITTYLIAKFDGIAEPQSDAIEQQAFETSFDQARAAAAARAREDGAREGQLAGQHAGERAGARIGERRGSAAAERAQAKIAKQQATEAALAAAAARRRGQSGGDSGSARLPRPRRPGTGTRAGTRPRADPAGTGAALLRCGGSPLLSEASIG